MARTPGEEEREIMAALAEAERQVAEQRKREEQQRRQEEKRNK